MTLQQLQYFCAIAREGSFRRASEVLKITQPSLSSAIFRLEEELGFLLFERKGRHIEVTKYGRYYYEQLSPILERLNFVTERARSLARGDTGHIDLAYNAPFGKKLVPTIARGFLDQPGNERCTFHFHQTSSHRIVDGLQNGQFDVGICSIKPSTPGVTYIPILNQELVGIVPKNHPLASRKEVSLKELTAFPYVDYTEEVGIYSLLHRFLEAERAEPQLTARAPDEESIAALVAAGFGVSFIASISVLKNFDVVTLPIKGNNYYRTIYMVHTEIHYLTPAVQRFIQYVVDTKITIN